MAVTFPFLGSPMMKQAFQTDVNGHPDAVTLRAHFFNRPGTKNLGEESEKKRTQRSKRERSALDEPEGSRQKQSQD